MRSIFKLVTGAGLLLATAVATPACVVQVDDNIGDAVDRFCDRLVACGTFDLNGFPYSRSSCQDVYGTLRLPVGCPGTVEGATCAELDNPNSFPYEVCFPLCSVTTCGIDGDSLDFCRDGFLYTYDCDAECSRSGKVYTGVCGSTYQGQTTATGEPDCWCQ
ncbi:MAG: hypothetical protein FJ095_03610 [Deltaproteobacteria bacterium]|nr:hypothetical protein [Deltaproteobacteria bacterium]